MIDFNRMRTRRGQAITEVVLMLPILFVFMFFIVRIFLLLVLVQKLEIASFYAARRYQLQSHRGARFSDNGLEKNIEDYVKTYLGAKKYPGLGEVSVTFEATQVWRIITITANVRPMEGELQKYLCKRPMNKVCSYYTPSTNCERGYEVMCEKKGIPIIVKKYVAPRDRYLEFSLPGLSGS